MGTILRLETEVGFCCAQVSLKMSFLDLFGLRMDFKSTPRPSASFMWTLFLKQWCRKENRLFQRRPMIFMQDLKTTGKERD